MGSSNGEKVSFEEIQDHLLVRAWLNQETGKEEPDHCLSQTDPDKVKKAGHSLAQKGLVTNGAGPLRLTAKGDGRAQALVRRHRLAERLFSVVFNLSEEAVQAQACRMEHEQVLTPEAEEGICSFLGHPPTCPHGRPIPPGECCRLFKNEVKPLVVPLEQAEVGENYKIIFIAPKYHGLLERLAGLGMTSGARLRLSQKKPACVCRVAETEVALDAEVASGIYVVPQV